MLIRSTTVLALLALPFLASGQDGVKSTVPLCAGLSFADPTTIKAPHDFLRGFQAKTGETTVNAVVEIPCGTNEKWEVKLDGVMRWDLKNGAPRVVEYLGYPTNYGIVPRAILGKEIGGDGDPLDILVLGPAMPRGTVVSVKVIGLIHLVDGGETDDKVLAVVADGPLGKLDSMNDLERDHPGVTTILKTWFENYKGPGKLTCSGFGSRGDALELIEKCEASFTTASDKK
ncbi:MAG: inorganic diphosphatase [Planctomycetota bacterium]